MRVGGSEMNVCAKQGKSAGIEALLRAFLTQFRANRRLMTSVSELGGVALNKNICFHAMRRAILSGALHDQKNSAAIFCMPRYLMND
ncbi:hypothetical protein LJC07_00915 [Christensenellaceae bacterium OttesenSCG-928-L17]|nr:hypothetical protein [Christensenellaceae bacterium OttesenSCG-928-L17]